MTKHQDKFKIVRRGNVLRSSDDGRRYAIAKDESGETREVDDETLSADYVQVTGDAGEVVFSDEIAAMCRDSGVTREEYISAMTHLVQRYNEQAGIYDEGPGERAMIDETIGAIASLIEDDELERTNRELEELRAALEGFDG